MNIKNKNIVITGGSDGIGLEVVKKLVTKNANVIVVSRHQGSFKNSQVRFYPCDIKDGQQINSIATKIINDFPNIHCLLNIAFRHL